MQYNNFLKFFVFVVFASTSVFAQTASYSNKTIMDEANKICTKYSSYQSVYGSPTIGGGGSVPVDLNQLRPVLQSIDNNSRLTANEMRQADMIRFCTELPNMAAASQALAQTAAKELKNLADNCYADVDCLLKRVYNTNLQGEVTRASQYPVYGREIAKLISTINIDNSPKDPSYDEKLTKFCIDKWSQGSYPSDCYLVPGKLDVAQDAYMNAKNRLQTAQSGFASEAAQNKGIIASRRCTETYSKKDPTQVKFTDPDCKSWDKQPVLVNEETLKQITALPYTQAYSPANVLGADPTINNISTRVQNGNLVDPNISSNLGSTGSGGQNGGGGNSGGGTDLGSAKANYDKIMANIGMVLLWYDVGRAQLSKNCTTTPITTRAAGIKALDDAKKPINAYKTDLAAKWEKANKTPKENHLDLIVQINFDLKDKYNQDLIDKVKDAVVEVVKKVCTAQ